MDGSADRTMSTEARIGESRRRVKIEMISRPRISFRILFSVLMFFLGIVCIGWALVNIRMNNGYSENLVSYAAVQTADDGGAALNEQGNPVKSIQPVEAVAETGPKVGDVIGNLRIPVLNKHLPIIQGTGTEELKAGVGHFVQSVMPGVSDNCVLSGHRDSVFSGLGKLKIKDMLIVEMRSNIYTYEIVGIRIVDKHDKTVIVPTDHGVLTLTTCYPFSFVGNAPKRYIVTADLVAEKIAQPGFVSGGAE